MITRRAGVWILSFCFLLLVSAGLSQELVVCQTVAVACVFAKEAYTYCHCHFRIGEIGICDWETCADEPTRQDPAIKSFTTKVFYQNFV